jgi:hypothetical protein
MTLIRFGVWKKEGKKRSSKNDKVEVPGNFDDENFTRKAMDAILEKYPGWSIMGFCEHKETENENTLS